MNRMSSYIKMVAAYLESDSIKAMKLATTTGIALAQDLTLAEQNIIGNVFIVIGNILIKLAHFSDDEQNEIWQQAREAEIELTEIRIELQKKRLDELKITSANHSHRLEE
jgi:deoxyhypusine synthase